ncbi:MAG: TIGR02449 family protein [Pseudomonadales bacterium]|nr:TIGR02449 family protein [Pseudomonadales bacterium]
MSQLDLATLERRLEELIRLCDQLSRDNQALLSRHQEWAQERARLIEKNELARSKIEAMIGRLKGLEQDG